MWLLTWTLQCKAQEAVSTDQSTKQACLWQHSMTALQWVALLHPGCDCISTRAYMRSGLGSTITKSAVFTSSALCMPSSIHEIAISTLDITEVIWQAASCASLQHYILPRGDVYTWSSTHTWSSTLYSNAAPVLTRAITDAFTQMELYQSAWSTFMLDTWAGLTWAKPITPYDVSQPAHVNWSVLNWRVCSSNRFIVSKIQWVYDMTFVQEMGHSKSNIHTKWQ